MHLSVHLIYIELDISNHQIPLLAEDFSYALNFKTWIVLWLFKSIYTCIYRIYNIPKYFIENLVLNIPIPIMSYLFSMCIVLIHPNFCVKMLIDKWNYELLVCCKSYWCYINIVIDLFSFVILNNSIKHCLVTCPNWLNVIRIKIDVSCHFQWYFSYIMTWGSVLYRRK